MAVVQLSQTFTVQLEDLKATGTSIVDAAQQTDQRRWNMPRNGDWSGDPLDVAGIAGAFNRDDINNQYVAAMVAGGLPVDIIAANNQVDYLAMQERAVRCRHMTPIRARFHAANRRRGHGSTNGIFDNITQHVINILSAV